MKLLHKVGDALLAKLVPGIEAKANCGVCRRSGYRCKACCLSGTLNTRWYFYDDCSNYCYSRCYSQGLECSPDRPLNC
jgi:hypothetical protein